MWRNWGSDQRGTGDGRKDLRTSLEASGCCNTKSDWYPSWLWMWISELEWRHLYRGRWGGQGWSPFPGEKLEEGGLLWDPVYHNLWFIWERWGSAVVGVGRPWKSDEAGISWQRRRSHHLLTVGSKGGARAERRVLMSQSINGLWDVCSCSVASWVMWLLLWMDPGAFLRATRKFTQTANKPVLCYMFIFWSLKNWLAFSFSLLILTLGWYFTQVK